MKIDLDKYYTDKQTAKNCIDIALKEFENITEIIEPSAGSGAFSLQIPKCIAYDIAPEHESIKEQDFLKLDLPYKKGRLIIGNPPFGVKNTMSVQFFKKASKIADYIAYILPISQLNNNRQMYDFDLIKSIDLGEVKYTDRNLHCCFNLYQRPKNGLNKKPNDKIKGIRIIEYRRTKKKEIPLNFDFSMGCFGGGCCGVTPKYIGKFAIEMYFYIEHEKKEEILKVLNTTDWKAMSKGVAKTYRLPQWKVLKHLKERINGLV
tara:strand:- start:42 stop:827 length:786 start_codon:yes stop_codon:yes gene_type:complete